MNNDKNYRNFELHYTIGTNIQRMKAGCRKVNIPGVAGDSSYKYPNGKKRNPGRIRMKTIGSFQVPIGYGYSHDCPLGEKLANKYMH